METYSRCYATVNLKAIEHNIDEVRKKVGADTMIMAVVKANAYGHGAKEVADCLRTKVEYFGVATIEEAIELREAGIDTPILILGYTSPKQFEYVIKYNVTQTIYTYEDGCLLDKVAEDMGGTGKYHIAIDTGMTRIGFSADYRIEESIENVLCLSRLKHIELEGAFTHFSCADMYDKTYSYKQKERLLAFLKGCEEKGIDIPVKHASNSAGIMEFDDMNFNMVRSGIITYGLYPSKEVDMSGLDLIPAMEFKTHVIKVNEVPKGESISYGATYTTTKPTKVATLSVGYADGYKRSLSNKGRVIINGKYAPVIGRVCMDQMMVDVSDIETVKVEDVATLFGRDGSLFIPVEEIADMSYSFNYEYICSISERVKRIY
ncbi:MAG: alanine racemase [Lachnospiraceae bacterium]|nr:alanine racemase [Lachnospiraceae bacterium]MDE6699276.1 alanine racemase [Lachnospiraceae bacterium]